MEPAKTKDWLANVKLKVMWSLSNKKLLFLLGAALLFGALVLAFVTSPWTIRSWAEGKIFSVDDVNEDYEVAIVFGAGLKEDGSPSDVLKDRLITAAEIYWDGDVDKIFVSGDNSVENYNEPEAMANYLVGVQGISTADVVLDYAGRRTYDTCARAQEIWGIESAILVTQEYHLPRALFTCEKLGIESIGVSATRQAYVYDDLYQVRELLATYKAVLDVYLLRPDFIGGEKEEL